MTVATKEKKHLKLTIRDYELMPDNGKLLQLIEGDFYMTPSPIFKHQEVLKNIEEEFLNYLRKNPVGKIVISPMDIIIDRYDVVQPDLFFIAKENYKIITEKNVQGPPDLIIEILSEYTEEIDRELKMDLYCRFGVIEYWIVNIEKEQIEVFEDKEEGYKLKKIYRKARNDRVKTNILPGFEIDLKKVFFYDWI